jgi:Partial alpha/beta-hydrolase lipase region
LIQSYGYPIETHTLYTEDGYLLTAHRIPCSANCANSDKRRQPILLTHGIFVSSVIWVVAGPGKGLAFDLADAGYDGKCELQLSSHFSTLLFQFGLEIFAETRIPSTIKR